MLPNLVAIISIYCCIRLIGESMKAYCLWRSSTAAALQLLLAIGGVFLIGLLALEVMEAAAASGRQLPR